METAPAPKTQKQPIFLAVFLRCIWADTLYVLFYFVISNISHAPIFVSTEVQVVTLQVFFVLLDRSAPIDQDAPSISADSLTIKQVCLHGVHRKHGCGM